MSESYLFDIYAAAIMQTSHVLHSFKKISSYTNRRNTKHWL